MEKAKEGNREAERGREQKAERNILRKIRKIKMVRRQEREPKKGSEKRKTSMDATRGKGKRLYQDRNEKRRKMMLVH